MPAGLSTSLQRAPALESGVAGWERSHFCGSFEISFCDYRCGVEVNVWRLARGAQAVAALFLPLCGCETCVAAEGARLLPPRVCGFFRRAKPKGNRHAEPNVYRK
jgi:hypothetical protein